MSSSVPVHNPANGEVIGHRPVSTLEEVDAAVSACRDAQPEWAALEETERIAMINKGLEEIASKTIAIAELLTKEHGKPLKPYALGEVQMTLMFSKVLLELKLEPEVVFEDDTRRDEAHYTPYGVVGVIGPWNYPLNVPSISIIPALRVGNTVVLKPSEYTTLVSIMYFNILKDALPPGVFNIVYGAGEIGANLVEHTGVDKIVFTGSVATGRKVAAACGALLKPVTLELGGNDPAIILPGANIETVAPKLFWPAFMNCGQTCVAIKRLYVHRSQYDSMVRALAGIAKDYRIGDGLEDGVKMGPLQNKAQLAIVEELVDDARAQGARIVTGGKRGDSNGYFYEPTIVADIPHEARLVQEEQFGPALPILPYDSVDEAVKKANNVSVGLGASVWGEDNEECGRIASQLEAGSVWVNSHARMDPRVPFGGMKQSGIGSEMGVEGMRKLCKRAIITVFKDKS